MDGPLSTVRDAASAIRKALGGPSLPDHFAATYFSLRVGMITLAVALPVYLTVGGKLLWDVGLQDSLSAYYHAEDGALRDEFVGTLVAVGAFLILYKGFNRLENLALNVAGFSVIGVAFVPMAWRCGDSCSRISDLHGVFAYSFFACIFYVAFFRSSDTLIPPLMPEADAQRYRRIYRGLSVGMASVIVLAGLVAFLSHRNLLTIVLESVGVWAFATYWIVKGREMRRSSMPKLIAEGRIEAGEGGRAELFRQSPVQVAPPP